MKNHGIDDSHISFTKQGVEYLIDHYTKEAGLRNLSREVGSICRKVAKKVVMGENPERYFITPEKIKTLLGPEKYLKESRLKESKVGVSTGLAWTQAGGEILYVEAIRVSSTTHKGIILTGQLGKVMEESAQAAYSYIRMYSEKAGIASNWFKKNAIHIHLARGSHSQGRAFGRSHPGHHFNQFNHQHSSEKRYRYDGGDWPSGAGPAGGGY